jgi:hypothetical protein
VTTLSELFPPDRLAEIAECGLRHAGGDAAIDEWEARCRQLALENPNVPLIEIFLAAGLDVEQEYFGHG